MNDSNSAWRARRAVLWRSVGFPIVAFLVPTRCFGCGDLLGPVQHLGGCPACWAGLRPLLDPTCPICASPQPVATDLLGAPGGCCARCVGAAHPGRPDRVRAAVLYDEMARRFLLRAKFGRRAELLEALGAHVAAAARVSGLDRGVDLVAAAPSHPLQDLRRGFAPGSTLARALARELKLPGAGGVLVRGWRGRLSSKRLSARERQKGLAIRVRRPRSVAGRRVLLVDDVMTTGATLRACAAALWAVGASGVSAVVWARRLPPEDADSHAFPTAPLEAVGDDCGG